MGQMTADFETLVSLLLRFRSDTPKGARIALVCLDENGRRRLTFTQMSCPISAASYSTRDGTLHLSATFTQ